MSLSDAVIVFPSRKPAQCIMAVAIYLSSSKVYIECYILPGPSPSLPYYVYPLVELQCISNMTILNI